MIGPDDGPGEESFDFIACSPNWLAQKSADTGPIWGHGYLILDHFDYEVLRRTVERVCAAAVANTWDEVAARISRLAHWEFDDYQPYKPES